MSVTHTLSPVRAVIAAGGASRNGTSGIVTITTTNPHGLNIGQSVTIAGVSDASFNGTFTIVDVPTVTTLTYAQAGATATSGSGTVTGLPLANIVLAQTSQGTCTAGGTGVITVTCNQGSLSAGASTTMTVIVQIQSQAILNSVVASGTDAAGTAASKRECQPADHGAIAVGLHHFRPGLRDWESAEPEPQCGTGWKHHLDGQQRFNHAHAERSACDLRAYGFDD